MLYPKHIKTNDSDLDLAIREGMKPMLTWYDPRLENIPYWSCTILGNEHSCGHHASFSPVHMTGRYYEALAAAEELTGVQVPQEVYGWLDHWTYKIFDNDTGMMQDLDPALFPDDPKGYLHGLVFGNSSGEAPKDEGKDKLPACDLHNLREAMYNYVGILKRNPNDERAQKAALHLIDMVDKYTDFETGNWKFAQFEQECHSHAWCAANGYPEPVRFASTLGRYIGALVRLYEVFPSDKALSQALRLTDTCFKNVMDEAGTFKSYKFARHIHSTTSMLAGIARLGELVNNMEILERVKAFMDNGAHDIAMMEIGWSTENDHRFNLFGEANNSAELMEACICLGRAGFDEYFGYAEKIMRRHVLPSQLLDTSFLPDEPSEDPSQDHFASRMVGAFGAPSPLGHEVEDGLPLWYGWDNLAGAVSGLVYARRCLMSKHDGLLSIDLLFDFDNKDIAFQSPYTHNDKATIISKQGVPVRLRLSELTDRQAISNDLNRQGATFFIKKNWLYLFPAAGKAVEIPMHFTEDLQEVSFRSHRFRFNFKGDSIIAAQPDRCGLCFFPDMEK